MKKQKKKISPNVIFAIMLALLSSIIITIIAYNMQKVITEAEIKDYTSIAEDVLSGKTVDYANLTIVNRDNYVTVCSSNLFVRGYVKVSISDNGDITSVIDYEETARIIGSIVLGIIAGFISLFTCIIYNENEYKAYHD